MAAERKDSHIIEYLADPNVPFRKRYEVFEKLYDRCRFTSYARSMVRGLEYVWGIQEISYQSLSLLNERMQERDNNLLWKTLARQNVKAQIADIFVNRFFPIIHKEDSDYTELSYFAFPLPVFHRLYSFSDLSVVQEITGTMFGELDEYVMAVDRLIEEGAAWGAVCIKDQSAYFRTLRYASPAKADAERVFNQLVSNPLASVGTEEGKVLDDWLFHHFMRMAAKRDIPVQIHTGLQDRICLLEDRVGSDITQVNATQLMPVLERHRDVRFDLFHASWPYMGEILSLAKNFPNVYIDMCWAHSIDPDYSVELLKRAVKCLPKTKILGFGSDAFYMENGVGYLELAKDNIAKALSDLVEENWLDMQSAKMLAFDWLYQNPKEMFLSSVSL